MTLHLDSAYLLKGSKHNLCLLFMRIHHWDKKLQIIFFQRCPFSDLYQNLRVLKIINVLFSQITILLRSLFSFSPGKIRYFMKYHSCIQPTARCLKK